MSPYERVTKLLTHSEEHFAAGCHSLGFATFDSAWVLLQHLEQPLEYIDAVMHAERVLREAVLPNVASSEA